MTLHSIQYYYYYVNSFDPQTYRRNIQRSWWWKKSSYKDFKNVLFFSSLDPFFLHRGTKYERLTCPFIGSSFVALISPTVFWPAAIKINITEGILFLKNDKQVKRDRVETMDGENKERRQGWTEKPAGHSHTSGYTPINP